MLQIGPDETFDHAAQVARLLDQIQAHSGSIRRAVDAHDVTPKVGLWWGDVAEGESTPALHFPVDLLARILNLPAALDIDV
jgi:hypothetical protein